MRLNRVKITCTHMPQLQIPDGRLLDEAIHYPPTVLLSRASLAALG